MPPNICKRKCNPIDVLNVIDYADQMIKQGKNQLTQLIHLTKSIFPNGHKSFIKV